MYKPFPEARRLAAQYRTSLGELGFRDDGCVLQGPVSWTDVNGVLHTEQLEITLDEGFPFTPPLVRPVADTSAVSLHQERTGHLCLFDRSELAGAEAPWRDPAQLLDWIAAWFEQSNRGWPEDTDVDLERYLERLDDLVVYDSDDLTGKTGALRVSGAHRVGLALLRVALLPVLVSQHPSKKRGKRRGRHYRRSARAVGWLTDLGELAQPILTWEDVAAALHPHSDGVADRLARNIRFHGLEILLCRYTRNGITGYLALRVRARPGAPGGIDLRAMQAADEASAVTALRSGDESDTLAKRRVLIVGCGAVGSYVADLLLRRGVRRMHLVDPDIVQPGNCIRHLAGLEYVGYGKVQATRAVMARSGADVSRVTVSGDRVRTLTHALDLVSQAQLIIDATADNRATALLAAASAEAGRTLLSVALIRQGAIAIVDRIGEDNDRTPLPTPPPRSDLAPDLRERGCGDAVSRTPPHNAVAAATLVTGLAVDELLGRSVPTSTFQVLEPQPDHPYEKRGVITS